MKKIVDYLPFLALFLLPLLLYPVVSTSSWTSSSDVHAALEFASSLLAITAGIMILLHFLTSGRWFFLAISIGFVVIGAEEFVLAIFSFNRIWLEIPSTFALAVSTTWLTGQLALAASFLLALLVGEEEVVPGRRPLNAVVWNAIGLIVAASVAVLIFTFPSLPSVVQLGSSTRKLIELSLALLYFAAFLLYSSVYLKQQSRSPLLWSIVACIVFRVLAHIFVLDAQAFYDAHWDAAHLLVLLSYFFPIFGVWGESIKLYSLTQVHVTELAREMTERRQGDEALARERNLLRTLMDNLPDRVYIKDAESRYVLNNPAHLRSLGMAKQEDVLGKTSFDFFPQPLAAQYRADEEEVIRSGQPLADREEIVLDLATGQPAWHLTTKVPFRDSQGKVAGLVGVSRDITERRRAEEALRDSEERFRAIAANTPDHILMQDRDLRYTFVVNPQLGLTEADMVGKTDTDIFPNEDGENLAAIKRRVLETGEPLHLEVSLKNLKGELEFFEGSYIPKFDSTGKADGLIGYFRNVTERERAEEALRDSERRLLEAQHLAHIGSWQWTISTDTVDWSEELHRINGRDPNLPAPCYAEMPSCYAPESWTRLSAAVAKALQSGESYELDLDVVRPDGTTRQTFARGQADYDAAGKIVALHGTVQDVTEQKRAEAALRDSETRYRSLTENSPDLIARFDRQCRHMFVNPAAAKAGRYSPDEYVGKTIAEVGSPEPEARKWEARIKSAFETGQIIDVEDSFETPYGLQHFYTMFVPELAADGAVQSVQSIARDITQRKRAEEALREREGLLRGLFDNMTSGAAIYDVINDGSNGSDYIFKDLNATGLRIEGKRKDEVVGKSLFDLRPNIDHYGLVAVLQKVWRTGEPGYYPSTAYVDEKYHSWYENRVFRLPTGEIVAIYDDVTERRRAEEAERDQRQLAEALCETAAALNRTLDLDQVLDTILENAGKVAPHDAGEVLLLTPGGRLRDARHTGYEERGLEEWAQGRDFALAGFPILARIAETRQPIVVPDTRTVPDWVDVPETRWMRSYVCAPIVGKDQVVGFINLSSVDPNVYGLEHARRLGAFADQAAVALENAGLFSQVRGGREQLRSLSRRLLESQELERRRVARELHDEVGQLLTGLKLVLQMTAAGVPDGQKPGMEEAETLVDELMSRVRQLSLDLRPAMLDDLGLLPALLWHITRYSQQTRVAVDFKHAGIEGRRFSPELETAAYRIVQEALTNVARYSRVSQASVRVWSDSEALTVQVEDEGAGFDPEALLAGGKTSGLAGMRERVVLLNGQLTLETSPGQGTHLTAVLPLAEPVERRAVNRRPVRR
jgi:PAS domain S-box-containing protein